MGRTALMEITIEGNEDFAPFRLDIAVKKNGYFDKAVHVYGVFDWQRDEFQCRSFHFRPWHDGEGLYRLPESTELELIDCEYAVALRMMAESAEGNNDEFPSCFPENSFLGLEDTWIELDKVLAPGVLSAFPTEFGVAKALADQREPLDLRSYLGSQCPRWLRASFVRPPEVDIRYSRLSDEEREYALLPRIPVLSERELKERVDDFKVELEQKRKANLGMEPGEKMAEP